MKLRANIRFTGSEECAIMLEHGAPARFEPYTELRPSQQTVIETLRTHLSAILDIETAQSRVERWLEPYIVQEIEWEAI